MSQQRRSERRLDHRLFGGGAGWQAGRCDYRTGLASRTLTDNVLLTPANQSDFVTTISPGVAVTRHSPTG